jgi:hypothetical protein
MSRGLGVSTLYLLVPSTLRILPLLKYLLPDGKIAPLSPTFLCLDALNTL